MSVATRVTLPEILLRFLQVFVHNHTNLRTNPPPSLPPSLPLTLPPPSSVLWQCQVSRSARSSLRLTQITFQSPRGSSCRTRFVPLLVIEWHFTSNPHTVGLWSRCLLFFHALNLTGRLSQSGIAYSAASKEKLWVKAFCFSLILSISEPTDQIYWTPTTKSYLMHDNTILNLARHWHPHHYYAEWSKNSYQHLLSQSWRQLNSIAVQMFVRVC